MLGPLNHMKDKANKEYSGIFIEFLKKNNVAMKPMTQQQAEDDAK